MTSPWQWLVKRLKERRERQERALRDKEQWLRLLGDRDGAENSGFGDEDEWTQFQARPDRPRAPEAPVGGSRTHPDAIIRVGPQLKVPR